MSASIETSDIAAYMKGVGVAARQAATAMAAPRTAATKSAANVTNNVEASA